MANKIAKYSIDELSNMSCAKLQKIYDVYEDAYDALEEVTANAVAIINNDDVNDDMNHVLGEIADFMHELDTRIRYKRVEEDAEAAKHQRSEEAYELAEYYKAVI